MPDAAVGALLLATAVLMVLCGMAWLALSLDAHWRQVRGPAAAPRGAVRALRTLGSIALLGALGLCWQADHPTMAPLVWLMSLAAAALLVAFTLSWRARWLAPLVVWLPAAPPSG